MVKKTTAPKEIGTVAGIEKQEDEAEQAAVNSDEQQVVSEPENAPEQPERDSGPTETLSSEETNEPEPTPAEMAEAEDAIDKALAEMQIEEEPIQTDDPDDLTGPVADPTDGTVNLEAPDDSADVDNKDLDPDRDDNDLDDDNDGLPDSDPEANPGSPEVIEDPANPGKSIYLASHNEAGHRNMFVNLRGQVTIMDDDVAETFYENPNFFSYTYDEGQKNSVHVSTLQWCDRNGVSIGEQVGKPYDLNR